MATSKCPMCKSPCIIKIVAMSDERWCEVDVCKMCGTMYPRDKEAVISAPPREKEPRAKKKAKKPRKK